MTFSKDGYTFSLLLGILALCSTNSAVDAGTISTLFNTGVDAVGHVLTTHTDGAHGISDPHYSLAAVPAGGTTVMEVYNYDQWFPAGPNSAWITPYGFGNGYGNNDVGIPGMYDYRTTFDLTGFNPVTALISGEWAADNRGTDILMNGHSTGQRTLRYPTGEGFVSFASFNLSSQFIAGINTLDFLVEILPGPPDYFNNPTGLRVEILSATADLAATSVVPEPTAIVISSILLGLFGMVRAYKRRKRISVVD